MTSTQHEDGPLRLAVTDEGDRVAWEAAAAGVLRKARRLREEDPDAAAWDVLTRTTLDGIALTPLGTAEDVADLDDPGVPGAFPFTRGAPTAPGTEDLDGWDVRTPVFATDADEANGDALADLEGGANSLWVPLLEGGLAPADLAQVLDRVLLDLAPVALEAPADPAGAARALCEVLDARGTDPHPGTNLGGDPLGQLLRRLALGEEQPVDDGSDGGHALVAELAGLARERGVRALVVDATAAHDLGASDAQEIGWSLAAGAAYLRMLTDPEGAGLSVTDAAALVDFRYAATDDQFATIAKLRAARRAWARVCEASGVDPAAAGQRQHAVTSRPMMSRYDPYVNMLRTTVAAFAAGAGGAQAVTVLPFDVPLGLPAELGRRVARNISHLLIHESHVGVVADPAGGAYAVEKQTDDLARAAWAELGRLESAGGAAAAVADGSFAGRVREVAEEREQQVAHRTRPLTGISEFPNLAEELPERAAWPQGALAVRPYGAAYEAMRDEPASRPVFLATMGTLAQHTARVTFTANLLAAGGVDTVSAGPTEGADDVVAAWREHGESPVAVLCGPDPVYAEWGAPLVAALREAGCAYVVVAGKPRDLAVDDHCAVGIDAVAFLGRVRDQLEEQS